MQNEKFVIKLKFVNSDGEVSDRQYTYYSPVALKVGDVVRIDENPKRRGIVSEINVPESEMEKFGDREKTIVGLWVDDETSETEKNVEETALAITPIEIDETLIVIEQFPVLSDKLQSVKADIDKQVEEALALPATEASKAIVKKARTDLNKQKENAETFRKAIKNKLLEPYEKIEAVFKECITDRLKYANEELGRKIDKIEEAQKDKTYQEILRYFIEMKKATGIEFVVFENAIPKVILSITEATYKRQINEFFDNVQSALEAIDALTDEIVKEETLLEYKKCLDFTKATTIVQTRKKELEIQRETERIRAEKNAEIREKTDAVNTVIQQPQISTPQPEFKAQIEDLEMVIHARITLKRSQKDMFKKFLLDNNISIEFVGKQEVKEVQ